MKKFILFLLFCVITSFSVYAQDSSNTLGNIGFRTIVSPNRADYSGITGDFTSLTKFDSLNLGYGISYAGITRDQGLDSSGLAVYTSHALFYHPVDNMYSVALETDMPSFTYQFTVAWGYLANIVENSLYAYLGAGLTAGLSTLEPFLGGSAVLSLNYLFTDSIGLYIGVNADVVPNLNKIILQAMFESLIGNSSITDSMPDVLYNFAPSVGVSFKF